MTPDFAQDNAAEGVCRRSQQAGGFRSAPRHWAGPFQPPPKLEQRVADRVSSVRDAAVDALLGRPQSPVQEGGRASAWNIDRIVRVAIAWLAVLAIVAAAGAAARREPWQAAGAAAALGSLALILQYLAALLPWILVALLLALVINGVADSCACCCCE